MSRRITVRSGIFPLIWVGFLLVSLAAWRGWFVYRHAVDDGLSPWIAGFRLDLSMACGAYVLLYFPLLALLISRHKFFQVFLTILVCLLWSVVCLVEFASVMMYREWGATLDARAISYLRFPKEAWASSHSFLRVSDVLFFAVFLAVGYVVLRLMRKLLSDPPYSRAAWVWLAFSGPAAFLGLRGGWQKLPIVPSDAFYSSDMAANFAATNKVWYLAYTMTRSIEATPIHSTAEIDAFSKKYRADVPSDTIVMQGDWQRKNIVLLVMEGWSASVVSYTGSKNAVTPFFDSLAQVSVRYSQAYSSGFRTDQGLMSLLSGMPSIQSINMPNVLHKVRQYPSLPRKMKESGRTTCFYYGGNANFSNLSQYLTTMDFDTIVSQATFPATMHQSEWGVPDHLLLSYAAASLSNVQPPFFSTLLLLSSHAPFDIPDNAMHDSRESTADRYLASVRYSDRSLRRFFDLARKESWFENTVFLLVSDHGSTHLGADVSSPARFRIPMIIYDPAHAPGYTGQAIDIPCNHFDVPATICAQTKTRITDFPFSRNLLSPSSRQKAYWNTDQVAACIGDSTVDIVPLAKSGHELRNREPVLFLDWVKQRFASDLSSSK